MGSMGFRRFETVEIDGELHEISYHVDNNDAPPMSEEEKFNIAQIIKLSIDKKNKEKIIED
ncbi:hypothetical protein [Streptococcus agalactiae]|uniref:hypothetical protein n=1 Tax=Streptococcus agalactiae TaxID=1311 RepID=UPI00085CB802|nr:hypothetical protein [Streptococcus agalactiae]